MNCFFCDQELRADHILHYFICGTPDCKIFSLFVYKDVINIVWYMADDSGFSYIFHLDNEITREFFSKYKNLTNRLFVLDKVDKESILRKMDNINYLS